MATPTLDRKVNEIVTALSDSQLTPAAFDPTALISIITTIINLFKGCGQSPQTVEQRTRRLGLLERLKLRRIIGQHASGSDSEEVLFAALMDAGDKLTVADVAALFKEIK